MYLYIITLIRDFFKGFFVNSEILRTETEYKVRKFAVFPVIYLLFSKKSCQLIVYYND